MHDFYQAGLLSGGLNALYGGLFVYEIEYTPGASPSDLCLGTAATPGAVGTPVALEPCGVKAKTLWIFAPQKTSTGTYYALISAATSHNFQAPVRADHAGAGHAAGDRAAGRRRPVPRSPTSCGARRRASCRAHQRTDVLTRILLAAAGSLITLAGVIFTLQGVGVIGGSFMSGTTTWAVAGPIIALAGLALIALALRRPRR